MNYCRDTLCLNIGCNMKQATQIVITGHEEIRLTITLKSISEKQESKFTEKAIQFYKTLIYQLHKEDELAKRFYEEEIFNIDLEDGRENEGDSTEEDDFEEDYEFDYHRYK